MRVDLLYLPGCPHATRLSDWLAAELSGRTDVVLHLHEVSDPEGAEAAGMPGSPTLLVDGVDPFATPGAAPSLSCRLYPDGAGRLAGLPDPERLRAALAPARRDEPDA